MNNAELEKRIDDLESRIAFMQVHIDELNGVVTGQHELVDLLRDQVKSLLEQMRGSSVNRESEKPPHY